MEEKLKKARWSEVMRAKNDTVEIVRNKSRMFVLMYDVYDKEKKFLGTCEVWYKEEEDKRTPVLKEFESNVPEFAEILKVANEVIAS